MREAPLRLRLPVREESRLPAALKVERVEAGRVLVGEWFPDLMAAAPAVPKSLCCGCSTRKCRRLAAERDRFETLSVAPPVEVRCR